MTISASTTRHSVAGDGVSTTATLPFRILDDGDVSVYDVYTSGGVQVSSLLTLGVDYEIPSPGSATTGVRILTPGGLLSGHTYVFELNVPFTQDAEYPRSDPFPAATHERVLDKLVLALLQTRNRLRRFVGTGAASVLQVAYSTTSSLVNAGPAGFTCTLEAGKTYRVRLQGHGQIASGGYGFVVRLNSAAAAGNVCGRGMWRGDSALFATNSKYISAFTGNDAGIEVTPATPAVPYWVDFDVVIRCTTGGTLAVFFATTSGSGLAAQLNPGFLFQVEEVPLAAVPPAPLP